MNGGQSLLNILKKVLILIPVVTLVLILTIRTPNNTKEKLTCYKAESITSQTIKPNDKILGPFVKLVTNKDTKEEFINNLLKKEIGNHI